jgi:hypothetical protein
MSDKHGWIFQPLQQDDTGNILVPSEYELEIPTVGDYVVDCFLWGDSIYCQWYEVTIFPLEDIDK